MARTKRPWGVVAAPVIFVIGLGLVWGAQSAMGMKHRVADWAHQLEHSDDAVVMEMPNLPFVPPLFINSNHVGRIQSIVVDRDRPGAMDSLRILAQVDEDHHRRLARCERIRLRVTSADLGSLKRALRCTADADHMVPFGHLAVAGTDLTIPLVVRTNDLPCNNGEVHIGACDHLPAEVRAELRNLERDLRAEARRIRVEMREARDEIRTAVRATVR